MIRRLFGLLPRAYRSRPARSGIALVCLALMLVSVNILARRFLPYRFDLTAEGLYTLSPATRHTLARIDEPITLHFYYSQKLGENAPSYGIYAQRVRELLDQYVAAAHGKLRLETFDPLPFSPAEDRAVGFGLQGVRLNDQGDQVYFGLAGTNSTDDRQVIPFFSPDRERLLEYDLTRLIHQLAFPKRTKVELISGLPLEGNPMARLTGAPSQPSAVLTQLRELYDVDTLGNSVSAIPAGTDVLMVVHPHKLPEKTLYAIDQYVLRGGKAMVFVDPVSEVSGHEGGAARSSDLPRLFKAWGIKMLPGVVAGDRRDARRVLMPTPDGRQVPMDYVAWMELKPGELNRTDPITADLKQLTIASAGILEPLKGAATKFEPLISTSTDSMKIPVGKITEMPDVGALLTGFKPDHRRYTLAARITGPIATAFPDGPPPAKEKPGKDKSAAANGDKPQPAPPFLRKSTAPANLVVVADTDMLNNRFWAQVENFFGKEVVVPLANNGDFVANAVEVLAGGQDLVGLRSRGTSVRPFEVVDRLQREADARYAAEQQALEQKLKETQAKLHSLTSGESTGAEAKLSPAEAHAVGQFRADLLATRGQLRAVQAKLRQSIRHLKSALEFADIALVPILVALAALVLGARRSRRWRRRRAVPLDRSAPA
jgi:ABC-type uncharacterized transport system involved in gliding motility auxiliary subunit